MKFDYNDTIEKIAIAEYKLEHIRLSKYEIEEIISDVKNWKMQCVLYVAQIEELSYPASLSMVEIDIYEYIYNNYQELRKVVKI